MSARRPWQGMLSIAWFNWPFYVAASVALLGSLVVLITSSSLPAQVLGGLALAGAAYFVFGSLGVSHLIYDRSDLYQWKWLDRALRGARLDRFNFCHSGFDEASSELRERFSAAHWQILDHYDEELMPEASIRRACRMFPPPTESVRTPFDQWPAEAASADVIFGILAIHELRTEAQRAAWFGAARRSLREGGRVVLVEHIRDLANFLAFGPGFLHFHSRASWCRCWERAGFHVLNEFRVTPWVRVFVLSP